ncbi:hypothetical protein C8J57DRAFT_1176794 [Mycena rebaudengoi]|nr:hypothetical protein C8J57DRAFT_1176794 [Mycena rebaudengoi]
MTLFLFLWILSQIQHLAYGQTLPDSWFSPLKSVCSKGDYPTSDTLNASSIMTLQEQIFGNYMQQSVPLTFQNSNTSAISGTAADAEWAAFMPFNNGFLTKRVGTDTLQFSISAFHAMHCLGTMRRILEIQFNSDRSFYHIHHCLIYLRNMVTCDADPTLEHDIIFANGTEMMRGDEVTHTCRDYKALLDMSDETAPLACTGM